MCLSEVVSGTGTRHPSRHVALADPRMARDPHSTQTDRPTAGVWLARIRAGTTRRSTRHAGDTLDPLLRQRIEDAATAASQAAERASEAAQAAGRTLDLASLAAAFGADGTSPEELLAAAGESIETAAEARVESERASTDGYLAKLAAQEKAADEEPRLYRHAGLGELWHR